jgi:hypothetical protein
MSVKLPNGSVISIAATYGASKNMTAISNATEAVATLEASHGVTVNDVVEVTSGWSRLSGRIARAKAVATNDVTLELINSLSTSLFPVGSGTGTVREVLTWTALSQVMEFSKEGGEQQFSTYSFLEDDTERQIPTQKSAESFKLSLGDDQTLPWYAALDAADADRNPRALRITLPSGAIIYANAYVTLNKTPTMTKGEVMQLSATFSLTAPITRYAS